MKPSGIFNVLDLARRIRANGGTFNPLFVGPPGVGKSKIVQQWANEKGLPFIDLRAAYLEAPDVIGFPSIENRNGRQITVHNTPEFLPTSGEGVLLLEEPNRGTSSIMNTFMQILTDRKVHNYTLPDGWIIVGCINPESSEYDVNTMDAALKDRFATFKVEYDRKTFVDYMKSKDWHKDIIMFVESGGWSYAEPESIGNTPGTKYISPRTLGSLNDVLQSGYDINNGDNLERTLYQTILGNNVGNAFWTFRHNEHPVLMSDLTGSQKRNAIKRLERYSDPSNLKNSLISITIHDILTDNTITDKLLAEVLHVLPVDQGVGLVRELEWKRNDNTIFSRLCEEDAELKKLFKDVLKHGKSK